ncbi:MAG: bifunctional 5,10-methylenetetrahydrofolate dehydrogenase/5,10-methenyltetrahydrofolate cyclohydrolase [Candidatus Colwellbacteria bacterium]|jgi:methylenetetrahydrofolate dehydrogenase (NADP+)/methenyltetrahydrofolate cyclohydrolase|nr:bifunctional 5,10-methylenetetrahydrofolate dehydrogenase/5,10-methenyltetrahydrofolate cyclohydrolase [Candidatus Colwellbacteria bacterium]MDD3752394.1 bifunctional 5,10-methylenetetrahydrofolate dehydrogenase/5,10-methenyltetrahydrofolate cyclohydrolase [Candidatus Colwellbacteria bacterium]
MIKINGKEIASKIYARLSEKETAGLKLAVLMAGEDSAISSFIKQKRRAAEEIGISFDLVSLPYKADTQNVINELNRLSFDKSVTAIVVQLPLPEHINKKAVIGAIPSEKDVDALNGGNVISPAVGVVLEIANEFGKDFHNTDVAVVGYGELVGKPVYNALKDKARSIKVLDKGSNISLGVAEADIIVLGTGVPGIVDSGMIRDRSLVIDFGYGKGSLGKSSGDFKLRPEDEDKDFAYTPTPGGTGPILVAKLFENVFEIETSDKNK